ncbi:MAG TPA: alpha/beta hydrolase, partial [Bacteroidales bacterium]|nr:alpha/beta hydrolase [Bacteroidales bacterium]
MNKKKVIIMLLSGMLAVAGTNLIKAQNLVLPLWPDGVPGSISNSNVKEDTLYRSGALPRIQHVTDPNISVYFPDKKVATGAAVVICPGGGYSILAFDHEGQTIAKWLNTIGITGIVLKYRLPDDAIMKDKAVGPLQDVQRAIRMVRKHAGEWGIDTNKVGVMGFSAGGHLAGSASTLYNDRVYNADESISARPDFSLLIYGVLSMQKDITHMGSRVNLLGDDPTQQMVDKFSAEKQVTDDTPPAFIVHSEDDPAVPVENSI